MSPNLTGAVYDIEYALIETQSMLGSLDNSFPDIQKALDDYSAVLKSGNADIVNTRQYVQQIRDGLQNVISGFDNLSNDEQFNEIVKLLRTDPTLIAQFVTSPLSMDCLLYTSIAILCQLCDEKGIPYQRFVNRSDSRGGSTLGSIAGTLLPVKPVDIGCLLYTSRCV